MNIIKPILKIVTFFSLFICAFMFTLPANAASREITPTANKSSVQLAYYHRGHRYHYNRGYHRGYHHRYYPRYHRYHHHYYRHY